MAEFYFYPFTIAIFIVFSILICASIARKKRRNQQLMMTAPVVVTNQQLPPSYSVQVQAAPTNTFQPNPSAPYSQNMTLTMPMAPFQNNQQFPQPYQNVYPSQPPPYPGIPQQQTDNQGGFKIGVEAFTSTTNGRSYEESRTTVARY